jgi:hypothetical protein
MILLTGCRQQLEAYRHACIPESRSAQEVHSTNRTSVDVIHRLTLDFCWVSHMKVISLRTCGTGYTPAS